ADDGAEGTVDAELQRALTPRPAQTAGHVQGGDIEHAALGWAEPQQRQLLHRPRKDALAVGGQDGLGMEIAADRDDAFRTGRAWIGELNDRHRPSSRWRASAMMTVSPGAAQDVSYIAVH